MMARELHSVLDREPLPTAPARPPRRRPWLVPLLVAVGHLLALHAVAEEGSFVVVDHGKVPEGGF